MAGYTGKCCHGIVHRRCTSLVDFPSATELGMVPMGAPFMDSPMCIGAGLVPRITCLSFLGNLGTKCVTDPMESSQVP